MRIADETFYLKLRTRCLPVELPGVWGGEDSYKPSPPGEFFSGVTQYPDLFACQTIICFLPCR